MKRKFGILFFLLLSISVYYIRFLPQQGILVFLAFLAVWSAFISLLFLYSRRFTNYFALISSIIFTFLIRSFYKQFPGVLVGPSYQPSYRTLSNVVEVGSVSQQYSGVTDAQYPGSYLLGSAIRVVSDLSIFTTVQWTGAIITLLFLLFVFLAGRQLFGLRPATLTVILLSVFPRYVFIHSSFIKETIGIVFFALILYLLTLRLVPREDISREQWSLLATLGIGGVTISHHLAAAISLTLFSSLFISQYLPLSNEPTTRSIDITGFSILTSVIVVSFWIYVQQSPLLLTITELLTALQPTSSSTGTPIQIAGTPGSAFTYPWQDLWNIAWNSSFILGPIAGVGSILTSLLIPKRRCISSGLIAFGSLMAMFTLILTVFSSASSSGAAWGGRFVVYGLAALYLVSTALVPRMPRLPNAKVFAGVLLVSVLILQGFATPPSLYIDSEQPIDVDKHSYYSQPSEKVAVDWTTENSLGGNLIQIDIWLYERTVSLYESPIQDRMRRIQQCGRRDLPISVTSINALPNSPDCEFIDRSKVFDSGTTKVNIQ